MKDIIKVNSEKGVTGIDIATGILILIMFSGVILTLMINAINVTNEITLNSNAISYVSQIFEDVDLQTYESVTTEYYTDDMLQERNIIIPDFYTTQITVEKYKDVDSTAMDILKRVNVTIKYTYQNEEKTIQISHLKRKE